jgi:hypothetical protein
MAQQTCVDCRATSPITESGQTLISLYHGWRLTRVNTPSGPTAEWRCPACWAQFKEARQKRLNTG